MEDSVTDSCGDGRISTKKSLQIRLLGHCIICLKRVRLKREENRPKISNYYSADDGDGESAPEIAPKSVVSTPGFLTTLNQVWTVLYTKWKDKATNKGGSNSSKEIGISLENVLQNGCVSTSTNVSFSRAPTICQPCCDKVLAVENLMKAVRQQVREINMLLEEGRRRQDGGIGDFEMSLREKGLEESVITATLQFVGIFGSTWSKDDLKGVDLKSDGGSGAVINIPNMMEMERDENGSLATNQGYSDNDDSNEGQTERLVDEDDDGDPDYIKSEEELEEDEDDESEEEMAVEDEGSNDPDYQVGKDPLALFPEKRKEKRSPPSRGKTKLESSNKQEGNGDDEKKFICSCGKSYLTFAKRRNHQRANQTKHPEYKPLINPDDPNNKFPCTCGKRFKTRKARTSHIGLNKELHPDYKLFGNIEGRRRLTCELCGERVVFSDLLQHFTDHLNGQAEWVLRCPNEKCHFIFVSSNKYNLHLSNVKYKECKKIWKGMGGVVCEICGFKGTNMLKLRTHVRNKHENVKGEEKKIQCPISNCGEMFRVKQSVAYHLTEHQYRPVTHQICDKCGESLKVEEMEGHLKGKHGIQEVIGCKQCPFKFGERDEMVEHLFEHRTAGILCDICEDKELKFNKYGDFREHYFGVHKLCPKKYKCAEGGCDTWFWRKETIKDHKLRRHTERRFRELVTKDKKKGEEFECDVCNVKFVMEDNLISHKIKVHGAEPFSCDICGDTFNAKGKMNKHKREHAGIPVEKEWRCEVEGCGKIFKNKYLWKHHVEVGHGGERRHVCEICGKGYTFAQGLKTHRDTVHLGLRPCVCDQCGESFGSRTVLQKHKLIHTGERPFGCEVCGQRFRHKGVLTTHLKGHEEKGAGFKPNGPMKNIRKRKAE